MKELKFIKVLTTLNKEEMGRLEKFFDSPYCNTNPALSLLLKQVIQRTKSGSIEHLDKISVWDKIFHDTPFNDLKWRKLCNDIMVVMQKFFTFEQLSTNSFQSGNLLLQYIHEHQIEPLYKSTSNSIQAEFNKSVHISSEFYLQKFQLERNLYDLLEFDINMESKSNQESIHHFLDLFYISEKTKQLVNAVTRRHDFNVPIEILLEKDVIEIIELNDYLKYPEIDIYYRIYKLKKDTFTDEAYEALKENLLVHLNKFSLKEAVDILKEVINFCTFLYNKGLLKFGSEQLQWYKYGLKHDLIFPLKSFHPGHFLNIVILGIRTKEFIWTENFIEEYQKIIPLDQKHTLVTFSQARLYFNQYKFDLVIEKLQDVEFAELTYNLDSKVLLLATYFEVEEWPAMASLADSFRTFLNRHEKDITAAKKLRYANFIKFVKRLSKVKYQDKAAKLKVILDIKSTEGVVNQGWLIEKATAI